MHRDAESSRWRRLACAHSSRGHVIGQLVEKHRALPGRRQRSRQTAAAGPTAGVFNGGARVSLRVAGWGHDAIGRHQSRPTRRLHGYSTVQRRVSRLQTTSYHRRHCGAPKRARRPRGVGPSEAATTHKGRPFDAPSRRRHPVAPLHEVCVVYSGVGCGLRSFGPSHPLPPLLTLLLLDPHPIS